MIAKGDSTVSGLLLACIPKAREEVGTMVRALGTIVGALNIFSLVGLIMLVGPVVKNATLLVDYTNTPRKRRGALPQSQGVPPQIGEHEASGPVARPVKGEG